MSEGDRPPKGDAERDAGQATARLRVYRGGARTRRPRLPRASVPREVAERLATLERRVEEALGGGGADRFGMDAMRVAIDDALAGFATARRRVVRDAFDTWRLWGRWRTRLDAGVLHGVLAGLYHYWWRIETVRLERVPASGAALLVTNRSGALLPYEALMIRFALDTEHPARRPARPLLEEWLSHMPLLGRGLLEWGGMRDGGSNVRRALERGEVVIAYPEGRPAVAKPFRDRYRLAKFGRAAFARLAIETGTPIVPIAAIGAEEVHPVLARFDLAGKLLGLPTLPITPTFPWLGVAGLVPLPTKWTLLAGEPLDVSARHRPRDANDPAAIARLSDHVRERLQALVLEGLRRRESLFRS
jgi:1-acyl-sn-glycerol-3-phosphate acyltransferase